MKQTAPLLLLLLCLGNFPAVAEEAPGGEAASGEAASGEAPGIEQEGPADLLAITLARDIDTAGYYELIAWCRELGLDDSGGRQELQARLYAYFEITPTAQKPQTGRTLEIVRALGSEYFTIEGIEENYILLEGDVLVEFKEDENIHSIRAERIILNQTEDILTAEGNIEYILKQGEEEEVFTGERLSFSIESWEGVFFRGGLESEREIEGTPLTFVFRGESITKLANDTIVLRNGKITSCENLQDPHYHLRARKIWVLAPNEWAITGARLYIGRIPLLYLPFFFHAGDEFFFHPVIGYKNREGNFIQTTSYLIGQKEREKSAFSFLSATEKSLNTDPRERKGLFLRPVDEEDRAAAAADADRSLKILLDYYSRLGLFGGIEGDFSPKGGFKGGLGLSRSLFLVGGGYETFLDQANDYRSYWNKSRLFGLEIPFRYGWESDWLLSSGRYSFNGRFEYFSDPYFVKDFYTRSEDFSWTGTLGGAEEIGLATVASERWNLSWELNANARFLGQQPPSWLQNFSLTYLNATLFWQSEEIENPASDPILAADPARRFYYPDKMKLPSASFLISGDILDLSSSPAPAGAAAKTGKDGDEAGEAPGKGYRDPIGPDSETSGTAPEKTELPDLRVPQVKEDAGVQPAGEAVSFLLSYRIQPNVILEETFDSEDWQEPEDVDYTVRETSLSTSGTSRLDYSLRLYDSLFGLSGSLLYDGSYQTRFDDSYDTRSEVSASAGAKISPLRRVPVFSASTLSYDLDWTFFRYLKENATTTTWQWSDETVGRHSLQAKLAFKPGTRENSLSFTAQLPPRMTSYTTSLIFYAWKFKTTVSDVLQETTSGWV